VISALLGYGLVVLWEWSWHLAHIQPEKHAAMVKEIAALQPDSATREADRKTLEDFLQILPSDGGIERLRDHNFAGWSFDYDWFSDINRFFLTRKDRPEYEFLEPDLERLRKELLQSISVLLRALSQHAFWVEGSNTRQSVPEEWETEQPARFEKAVKEIHKAAEDTCARYDALVRAGRNRLLS
jgi:hypothetical protein